MNVLVTRFCESEKFGTFGVLTVTPKNEDWEQFSCYTVEKPWKANEPFISCIPAGTYNIVKGMYHKGGYPAYEIVDVPERWLIKIHRGNVAEEVAGCLALGASLGVLDGSWAVLRSHKAYQDFMRTMGDCRIGSLTIQWRDFDGDEVPDQDEGTPA